MGASAPRLFVRDSEQVCPDLDGRLNYGLKVKALSTLYAEALSLNKNHEHYRRLPVGSQTVALRLFV